MYGVPRPWIVATGGSDEYDRIWNQKIVFEAKYDRIQKKSPKQLCFLLLFSVKNEVSRLFFRFYTNNIEDLTIQIQKKQVFVPYSVLS